MAVLQAVFSFAGTTAGIKNTETSPYANKEIRYLWSQHPAYLPWNSPNRRAVVFHSWWSIRKSYMQRRERVCCKQFNNLRKDYIFYIFVHLKKMIPLVLYLLRASAIMKSYILLSIFLSRWCRYLKMPTQESPRHRPKLLNCTDLNNKLKTKPHTFLEEFFLRYPMH